MKISIELSEALLNQFSVIKLCYQNTQNVNTKVELKINNFKNTVFFTKEISSVKFDFFIISAIIYGVDNLLNRELYSIDGWAREIEVEIPVYNLPVFYGNESVLEEALNFLTGDYWTITFSQNTIAKMFRLKKIRKKKSIPRYDKDRVKTTSLFSGGLDSLIGVIDELEKLQPNEKILLASHFDFKSPGANDDQKTLLNKLQNVYTNQIYWLQLSMALMRKDEQHNPINVETNYRSRSLFFIGYGVYISNTQNLIVPENGTISINYPLTPSRSSSLSTRTTHPFFISKIQDFLHKIGLNIKIENPYKFCTKGEMIQNCVNSTLLNRIYKYSVSCGKRGHKENWQNKSAKQCGVCMPCIYRRAALNKNETDNEQFGLDITQPIDLNGYVDLKALLHYLNKNITKEDMRRDILVNGSVPIKDLDNYADLIFRSRDEVLQLLKSKGNTILLSNLK